jgi:superfamily I DNA/RNA helicase
MPGRDLDLQEKVVKVLTLKSAKGLEFPIVALAGFLGGYPPVRPNCDEDEIQEILARERRTLFVGMTRAMRALLVIAPKRKPGPLLSKFPEELWLVRP